MQRFSKLPREEAIRALAHKMWEDEGRPSGRDKVHWAWAVAEYDAAQAQAQTAPGDVQLIGGVGPALKAKLAKAGIVSLSQIAAMSAADMAALDRLLDLKGRTAREAWIDQAKELMSGKAPRAKTDKALAAGKSKAKPQPRKPAGKKAK